MNEFIPLLDSIRLILGILILGYASYSDIKIRRAANYLWIILGIGGLILLIIQYLLGGFENIYYLLFIPLMILLMYLLFQVRLVFGGADAKALMALAILVPLQPLLEPFPIWRAPVIAFPGSWIIFSNSVILFLFIPLSLFLYNIVKRDITFPYCFLGYRMNLNEAEKKFVWPLEKIRDGKKIFSYRPSSFDSTEEYIELKKHGIKTIWVTPKIPFMIPLLAGFIATFILGDLLTTLLNLLI